MRRASLRSSLAGTFALAATLLALPAAGQALAAPGPALTVDVAADRHAISPEIYGMSYADPTLADELRLPVNRWGGNYTDRYNWRIDTWSTGRDWFFENISGCWSACAGEPPADPSQGYRRILDGDRATGAQTLLTLPMVGWVARQAGYAHPLPCSYPRSLFPDQDRWDTEWLPPSASACGNGRDDGDWITTNDPNVASTPSTAQLSSDWIADITARYGAGAVRWYGLGNEPALWNDTHVDVHPQPTTSGELRDKTIALARAAKQADPSGLTLGLSEWGWPAYFASAAEQQGQPDPAKPAGVPLVGWFLDQLRAAGEADGKRLLDYLDLHYYQQMTVNDAPGSTAVTRSLWDPSYTDESWIDQRIALLPRMHAWIADHYPGTKVALSEYDLSIGDPVLDTVIQADTLGILARERVDLAARWSPPKAGEAQANAFRLYRNYDGAGGRFGDTWVRSVSADQATVAVYGAARSDDGAITIAVVNKSGQTRSTPLTLAGAERAVTTAQAWQWSGAAPGARPVRVADVAFGGSATTLELPAHSLTMVVVPGDTRTPPPDEPARPLPTAPGQPADPPANGPTPGGATPGGRRPATVPPLPLADRVGLPSAKRCVRAATLKFRVRSPTTRRLLSARVAIGRRALTLGGRGLTRPVVLRGLPRSGAFTVKVRLRLAGERRTTVAHRRYQRCR
ncbi:glycoside hydrolase family 44 protein [Conexibacter stalactiti]|uniref:Glycoside hydrolase family 44 protein n=1 Tax=Conexibacter stalactiti TaxID=1940611 RepID=A0ABU4HMZ4_9ACTN|nr:glycoside hydrolase family 44 protein [Conexibacter stalactiti]MDW5594677.1 glycoside hydrolase family 44 protein [Conexibacter stalactiti]MEC5035319.1 glycoside hydrolase family 44 protein [Conexibacter stalactiti]